MWRKENKVDNVNNCNYNVKSNSRSDLEEQNQKHKNKRVGDVVKFVRNGNGEIPYSAWTTGD